MLIQASQTADSMEGEVVLLSALAQETYRRAMALSDDALEGNTAIVTLADVNKAFDTAVKAGAQALKAKVERLKALQENEDPEDLITPINVDFTVVSVPKSIERRRIEAIGVATEPEDYADAADEPQEGRVVNPADLPPAEPPTRIGRGRRGRGRL